MIFNRWRRYPRVKPKKDGWYQCTVDRGNGLGVMDLYYDTRYGGRWIDLRRKQVFNGYKVYKAGREPLEYNRVFEDSLCDREDVMAWKHMIKPKETRTLFRLRKM